MISAERIHTLREAGNVTRCHTMTTIKDRTVGHHTFNVLLILLDAVPALCTKRLMQAAMYHDLPELYTGDVPAPAKWDYLDLENALRQAEYDFHKRWFTNVEITHDEKNLLKCADGLELFLYCWEEVRMGNREAASVMRRIRGGMWERGIPDEMVEYVETLFEEAENYLKTIGV